MDLRGFKEVLSDVDVFYSVESDIGKGYWRKARIKYIRVAKPHVTLVAYDKQLNKAFKIQCMANSYRMKNIFKKSGFYNTRIQLYDTFNLNKFIEEYHGR